VDVELFNTEMNTFWEYLGTSNWG